MYFFIKFEPTQFDCERVELGWWIVKFKLIKIFQKNYIVFL
jgi:hypothetical protein